MAALRDDKATIKGFDATAKIPRYVILASQVNQIPRFQDSSSGVDHRLNPVFKDNDGYWAVMKVNICIYIHIYINLFKGTKRAATSTDFIQKGIWVL